MKDWKNKGDTMQNKKTLVWAIIISGLLLIIDQITKAIVIWNNFNSILIPNVLELNIVKNTGGAFGIGGGNVGTFIITNFIVLGMIIRFIYLQKDFMDKPTFFSLFIILAGGFGNVIDRISRGFVVDFITVFPATNFPTFNFADLYITMGWLTLVSMFIMYTYKEIKQEKQS